MDENDQFNLIIEPGQGALHYWKDLWRYKELFYFLSWRDILVRYKQTVMGVAWSVIRPLLTMVVFSIVFGKLAKLPSGNIPYPILVYAAMLPWQFFANALSDSSNSLIASANMLTKIYFPRLIVPASTVIVSLVDFFISLVIFAGLMLWYQFMPNWHVLLLPLFLFLAFFVAFGFGLWMASMNVKYRDFKYIVPFVVQFGLYVSPVGFSSSVIPEKWRFLYSLNPMVGVIDGFRWCLLGNEFSIYWPGFGMSVFLCLIVLAFGLKYFRKTERSFADIV